MHRVAYVVSHPIQYQAPLLRYLVGSGQVDLRVFYLSDFSLRAHREQAFGREVRWDVDLESGFRWETLRPWWGGNGEPPGPWVPVRQLAATLRAAECDALWVHGWGLVGLAQAIFAARRLGLPLLLRGEALPQGARSRGLVRWCRNRYVRTLLRRADACLYIGGGNREFYRQAGVLEERLFPVPYAVDNAHFQQASAAATPHRAALRASLKLVPGRPVFLFAAKFIPVKAPDLLLAAFRRLIHTRGRDQAYLLFVGDGPLRADLEQAAGDLQGREVRFLGFKNQSELPAYYDLCDVFVLPSRHEPWGLVVNEAMNAGKPILVSDRVGASHDLVQPGRNGWIFSSGDEAALHVALMDAVGTADLERMGKESQARIADWGFAADLRGLVSALDFVRSRRGAAR